MRYRFIEAEKAHYPVGMLCRVLAVTRSGFYAWRRRPASGRRCQDQWMLTHIRACHRAARGRYGSPRIYRELRARGMPIGRHRVARLMRLHGIRSHARRRWRVPQRHGTPELVVANRLQRQFAADRPNRKWAGDITYVRTAEGWLYVAVLMDLYSRRIIGWAMQPHLSAELAGQALEMAVRHRGVAPGLLHHSDRGSQYAAVSYQRRLVGLGIHGSMSRPGNCWDNAVVESFFATLKTELIHHTHYRTRAEAKHEIFEYIEVFYNCHRRHSTLGYLSPVAFEERSDQVQFGVH